MEYPLVRLGQGTRPTGQAVRVMARHVSCWAGSLRYWSQLEVLVMDEAQGSATKMGQKNEDIDWPPTQAKSLSRGLADCRPAQNA